MARRCNLWLTTLAATAFLFCGVALAEAQVTVSGGARSFHTNDAATPAPDFNVSCGGGIWNNVSHIRLVIPVGLNFTWDTSVGNGDVTYSGTLAPNMQTPSVVTYANGNKTVILTVQTSFPGINSVTISGLRFANFGAPSSGQVGGSNNGDDLIDFLAPDIFTILDNPTVASFPAGNQVVNPSNPPVAVVCNELRITEGPTNPGINTVQDLRISIPAGLNMTWDNTMTTGDVTYTYLAGASGTLSSTIGPANFEDGDKTIRLSVAGNFSVGRQVAINGLRFAAIGADSGPARLFVTTNGPGATGPTGNQAQDQIGSTKQIIGLPTVTMGSSPRFTVGDNPINAPLITVRASPGSPSKITAASNITLVLPVGMTWNTARQTRNDGLVFGGTGVGHIPPLATDVVVTYVPNARTAVIEVTSNFLSNETLTISGMQFMNFTGAVPATALTMNAVVSVPSPQTVAVGAPTLTSQVGAQGQIFAVDANPNATIAAAAIVVADDAQIPAINRITNAGNIRIRIPTTPLPNPSLVWDNTVGSVTCTGSAVTGGFMAGTATVLGYEDGDKTAVIDVAGNWSGDSLSVNISGLVFKNFTAPMTPRQMTLCVNGAGGTNCDNDLRNIAIGGTPKLDSLNDQAFTFNDPVTNAAQITVTDAGGVPNITAVNNIILKIPPTFPMRWNTARQTRNSGLAFAGTGVGHIPAGGATVVVTYSPDGRDATIEVSTDFAAAETLIITGMQFQNFTGTNDFDNLQLFVDPLGAAILDSTTIGIGRPNIALQSSQTFGQGDPSTALSQVTVTEDGFVPRITTAGIELHIPSALGELQMDWDTSITTIAAGLSFGGTGQGHVTVAPAKITYLTTKIARVNLDSPFGVNETLTIDGLRLMNFATSGPLGLRLEVNNSGTICRQSTNTLAVGTRPQILSMTTGDTNGNGSLDRLVVTFDKNIDPATLSATAGVGFTISAPTYNIGAASVTGAVLTLTLVERGTPDTGERPMLAYNPTTGNLQELGTGLEIAFTGPTQVADGAAPIITGMAALDDDGDGHHNRIIVSFSETLAGGQEDIADWRIVDADGTTNLLQGLGSSAILIAGSQVTFTLFDTSGTTGTPRFVYVDDPLNPNRIQDVFANAVVLQTNNAPPIVDVGSAIAVGPSKVTLDATRSFDPQGQPLTFSWQQIPGPTFALQNPNTATPFFLATTAGNYLFRVTVSNALSSATGDVDVTILNVPPGADAGSNQTASPGSFVFLVALGSTDANGDALTYTWTQLPGAAGGAPAGALSPATPGGEVVGFSAPAPAAPPATPDNILTFEVAVFDGVNTSRARTTVRLNSGGPLAPTADAGPDQVVRVGSLVTLDGSRSADPANLLVPTAGNPNPFLWSSTTPVSNVNAIQPTFTPTVPGLYTFQLVVTNSAGLKSFASTVRVLAQSTTNQAPVAEAHRFMPTGDVVIGDLVILDGTGSRDPEGAAVTYAWTQVAGPKVILADPSGLRSTFTPVREAYYEFQLIVSDGVNQSLPARVPVTVKQDPSATTFMASVAYGAGIAPNGHANLSTGALQLIASSTVPGNTWFFYLTQTGGPSLNYNQLLGIGSPQVYTFTPPVAGVYTFQLSATSGPPFSPPVGIMAFNTIHVVVDKDTAPADFAPTANAGAPITGTAGEVVTLDAGASTDDNGATFGAGLRAYWVQLEGPPVLLSDPYAVTPTFTPVAAGQYTFELRVTDAASSSAPSFVVVTVGAAPAAVPPKSSSGGGCGFLGLEGLLVLPLVWLAWWLRSRRRTA